MSRNHTNEIKLIKYKNYLKKMEPVYGRYGSVNEYKHDNANKDIASSFLILHVFAFLVGIAINLPAIYIGAVNQNATCYDNAHMISLSTWLILGGSVALILTCLRFVFFLGNRIEMILFGYVLVSIVSGLIFLVMTIIGIIELTFQYPSCHVEVQGVCNFAIAVVVLNILFSSCSCSCKVS